MFIIGFITGFTIIKIILIIVVIIITAFAAYKHYDIIDLLSNFINIKKYNKQYFELKKYFEKEFTDIMSNQFSEYKDKYQIIDYVPVNDRGIQLSERFFYEIKIVRMNHDESNNLTKYDKSVITNDSEFDERIAIRSYNKYHALASLNNKIRTGLLKYLNDSYNIAITDTHACIIFDSTEKVFDFDVIKYVIEYYERLSNGIMNVRFLQDNVRNDKDENCRITNFEVFLNSVIIENHEDFLDEMVNDKNRVIKIMACCTLSEKYSDEIVKIIDSGYENDIFLILANINHEKINKDIIFHLYKKVDNVNNALLLTILKYLYIIDSKKTVDVILKFKQDKLNTIESDEDFLLKIIEYIGKNKLKKSFNWLISLLERNPEITKEVINTLKNLDEIKAVEFLLPFTGKKHDDSIRIAASEAVNCLQSNINDDKKGILALMESVAGSLSMNDEKKEGNLTLEE